MGPEVRRQVEFIHAGPTMAVVAVAGGGAHALTWLLAVPGASGTILEARVPYSLGALVDFLGYQPQQVASLQTAVDMARTSHERARRLTSVGVPLVGVGCTAAIATDRPKRGTHRCFVAAWAEEAVTTYHVTFVKGLRDRQGEDELVSKLVLRALAEVSGVAYELKLDLDDRERIEVGRGVGWDPLGRLLEGQIKTVTIREGGGTIADEPIEGGVLPGSFDPLHGGHRGLAEAAARVLGSPVTFELSASNVDKPSLEADELRRRIAQFRGEHAVVITQAANFHEKADLFPGCIFVIGWDTAIRLVEPRYYGGEVSQMTAALRGIKRLGCQFVVAGRVDGGVFRTLDDAPVPAEFESMFESLPESAFRYDVSSTEMRSTTHQPP